MIENPTSVTTLEMTLALVQRLKLQKDSRFKLASYLPSHLKTLEKEFHVKVSSQSPQALREFSSGDSSPCDDGEPKTQFIGEKLSVTDVCRLLISTQNHEVKILEPLKTEKHEKLPPEWQAQRDVLLYYFDPTLEACKNKHTIKKYFKEKFTEYSHFIIFEEIQKLFLAGEQAYLIKLNDDRAAKFFYFNMWTYQAKHKRYLGDQFQVGVLRKLKELQSEFKVVLRFLPLQFTKEKIERILYDKNIDLRKVKAEELFEYEGCRYGMIYADDFHIAENVVEALNKYFEERRISQPEFTALSNTGGRISQRIKDNFTQFYKPQSNSQDKLQQTILKEVGTLQTKQYEPPLIPVPAKIRSPHRRSPYHRSPPRRSPQRRRVSSSSSRNRYNDRKRRQKSRTRSPVNRKSGWDNRARK